MHVICVVFEINEDHIDAFSKLVCKQAKNSMSREEGCHQFDVAQDTGDPSRFVLYELYTDEQAFETHRQTEHMAEFSSGIEGMVKSKTLYQLDRIEPK